MMNDILTAANLYAEGMKHVQERRALWLKQHETLKAHLKEVVDYLNEHATYKQGFYLDTLHAFNEDMNGTCTDMPSLTLRTGDMPMLVAFHNSLGERSEYMEEGFRISFNPTITGQVVILLQPHHSELNKNPPSYVTLAVLDPAQLTNDLTDQIIAKAIQLAYTTSFTGISEQKFENAEAAQKQHHYNPIGFKKYETTEKVK